MTESSIVFTDQAAQKVAELMREEGNLGLMLRVYITGGGCSGFQYGFMFDETCNDDDIYIEKNVTVEGDEAGGAESTVRVTLLIDPMSAQYLQSAEIDYQEDIQGAQFVIRNPNAKTTCGCGSSFSI